MQGDGKEKGKPFEKASPKVSDLRIRRRKAMETKAEIIRKQFLKATGLSVEDLKAMDHRSLYRLGLYHLTTTNKAICEALFIPVESGCRRRKELEDAGALMSSLDKGRCPVTGADADFLTTNPGEFAKMRRANQTKLDL